MSSLLDPDYERLCSDYAQLCAFNVRQSLAEMRRVQGLKDFPLLCGLPFVRYVGINVPRHELIVGTAHAFLRKVEDEPWRDIGQFIITLTKHPAEFNCQNITRTVGGGYHHPHINQEGRMCIDIRQEVLLYLTDGFFIPALEIIWAALNTTTGAPYPSAAYHHWPVYEEG